MSEAAQEIPMPQADEDASEYTITTWHVQAGTRIAVDDIIAEAMTDKANVEIPAPVAGTVDEVLVAEGDTVVAGQAIVRVSPDE